MPIEQQVLIIIDLLLAALLSMIIGMDRERMAKPAGLRTHILAGVGACLFTALSLYAFPNSDTSRVASNIVTGIGFLGAGVIFRSQGGVRDLTTAASIWATAAIGMAVGSGIWLVAIAGTLIIWFTLAILRRIDTAKTRMMKQD